MSGVSVSIGGTNQPLKDVLKDSTGAIVLSTKQWEQAFGKAGDGTGKVSKATEELYKKTREFSREQMQQGKTARFITNEFLDMVPALEGAKGNLMAFSGLLVEAAAGGVGFEAGMEAAKLAIRLVTDALQRAHEQTKIVLEGQKAVADGAKEAWDRVRNATPQLIESQKVYNEELVRHRGTLKTVKDQLDKLYAQGPGFWGMMGLGLEEYERKLEKLGELYRKAESDARNFAAIQEAMVEEQKKRDQAELAKNQISQDIQKKREAAKARGLDAVQSQAQVDTLLAINDLERARIAYQAKLDEIAVKRKYASEFEIKGLDQQVTEAKKLLEAEEKRVELKRQSDAMIYKDQGFAELEAQAYAPPTLKPVKKDMTEMMHTAKQLGEEFGSMWAAYATGAATAQQTMARFAQMMLKIVFDMAVKQVMANAAVAGTEAYKSQAGIPIVGPALAIAAMAAAYAAVSGMIGKIGSASNGWDLPGYGGPFPAVLHQEEMVLPANIARPLRESLANGGGSGGTVINISAVDAQSFEKYLKKNTTAVVNALVQASRNREI